MRRFSQLLGLLLLFLGLAVGMVLLKPVWLAKPVLAFYLSSAGFELIEITDLDVGSRDAAAGRLVVGNSQLTLTANSFRIDYALSELFAGKLRTLDIEHLQIELFPRPELAAAPVNSRSNSEQISELLYTLQRLPLENLRIGALDVQSDNTRFDIQLQMQTQPLQITGTLSSSGYPDVQLTVTATTSDNSGIINAELAIQIDSQTVLASHLQIEPVDNDLRISMTADADLTALKRCADEEGLFPAFELITEDLTLLSEFTVTDFLQAPGIANFSVSLDNNARMLHLKHRVEQVQQELQLRLPLQLQGMMPSLDSAVSLQSDPVYATASYSGTDSEFQGEINLERFAISCTLALVCDSSGELQVRALVLEAGVLHGENLHLSGSYTLTSNADGVELASPALRLSSQDGKLAYADTELQFAATIGDLSVVSGEQTRARFTLNSELIDAGFEDIELRNPAVSAAVTYAGENLQAIIDFSLASQLHARLDLNYRPANGSGVLQWQLAPYTFSKITPLSGLFTQSWFKADLLAGSIAANGTVHLITDASGKRLFEGPVKFDANALSGFYEDSFFVDFTTSVAATIGEDNSIRSDATLNARLATLDVGIPLTDIHWDYRFNSGEQRFTIENFLMHMLGGEVSMQEFDYRSSDPSAVLTIVLINLDLKSIVDLAEFPGLNVTGLVSGYLPLRLTGTQISIEEGLVGALQPGGTIRYVSENPIASSNASVDLVNRALANYHYQIMNTTVDYNNAGDLHLQLQLQGNNPDLYDGQVVLLNVGIDDNIPSLLRSLQASRTITDAFELRLQQRRQQTTQ